MIGWFLSILLMVFIYAYPAYKCFKTVELNEPDIKQLKFWCRYWILVAGVTIFERIGDTLVSWIPIYSCTKLAFFIFLSFPKTGATKYVYKKFFRPYVANHENEIDRILLEVKTKAVDMAMLCLQLAINLGDTIFFKTLQYLTEHL